MAPGQPAAFQIMEPEDPYRIEMEESRARLALKAEQTIADLVERDRIGAMPFQVEDPDREALAGRELQAVLISRMLPTGLLL